VPLEFPLLEGPLGLVWPDDEPFEPLLEDDPLSGLDEELLVPDPPVEFVEPDEELLPPEPPEFVNEPFELLLDDGPLSGLDEELFVPPVGLAGPDEGLFPVDPLELGLFPLLVGEPLGFSGPEPNEELLPPEPPEFVDEPFELLLDDGPLSGLDEELFVPPVGLAGPDEGLFSVDPLELGLFPPLVGEPLGFAETEPDEELLPPEPPEFVDEPFELLLDDGPLSGLDEELFVPPVGLAGPDEGLFPVDPLELGLFPPLVGEPLGFAGPEPDEELLPPEPPEFVDEPFELLLEDGPLSGLDEELFVPPVGLAGPDEELFPTKPPEFGLFPLLIGEPLGFAGPENELFPPGTPEFVEEPFVSPLEGDPLSGLDDEELVPDPPVIFAGPDGELFPPVPPELGLLPPLVGEPLGFAEPEFVDEPFVPPLVDKPLSGFDEELVLDPCEGPVRDPPDWFAGPDEELFPIDPPLFW
jgi:hypothetical protein